MLFKISKLLLLVSCVNVALAGIADWGQLEDLAKGLEGLDHHSLSGIAKLGNLFKVQAISDEEPGSPEFDHEAFLGEEAQDFDQLSEEESNRRLMIIVDRVDTNRDGEIDFEELKAKIKQSQEKHVVVTTRKHFDDVDRNKDGLVSWTEYYLATYSTHPDEMLETKDYQWQIERDHRRFVRADVDKDEKLNIDEFTSCLYPHQFPHMKEILVDEAIRVLDKNGDGNVDKEEFMQELGRGFEGGEEPEWLKKEENLFSETRDADGNGYLDKAEMKKWILPDDMDYIGAEAKHLIEQSDDNKDGKLSKDEILNHNSVFAGSQVTNWGHDLNRHDEF